MSTADVDDDESLVPSGEVGHRLVGADQAAALREANQRRIGELEALARRADEIGDRDARRGFELLAIQARLKGAESLEAFIRRVSPHHPPPRHFEPIIRELERARIPGERVRVCISMPPRHGKTTLIQHAIPWWLQAFPAETCAYASYSNTQAWSKSRLTRDLAARAGIALAPDAQNLAEWRTRQGGGLLSVGAGSGLTGQGVSGLMIVDDPFADPQDAQSQVIRDRVGEWFDGVVRTRLEGAAVFVIHTRWHEDDLIGRLTKDGEFTYINIPAIADEEDDPLGRAIGEFLWPERQDLVLQINESKAANAFTFAAMYQGRPRPRGAKVFGQPRYYNPKTVDLTGCRLVLAADPAASEKTSADHSAAVVLAIQGWGATAVAYVLEVYREQVTIPKFVGDLMSLQQRYGNTAINVEAVAGFKAIPQMLREINPDILLEEIQPLGDKFTRAQPAATAWNDGRILLPLVPGEPAEPWIKEFLQELLRFTGVKDVSDDQVDALSHAWNHQGEPLIIGNW